MRVTRAIVRPPGTNFADGLTRSELGNPSFAKAKAQHGLYCEALERCGLSLTHLSVDPAYPDGTFVEDPAIVTSRGAILTRPGAVSRRGEVAGMREALRDLVPLLGAIEEPGTLDGGDVCETPDRFLIGLTERTNEDGARQLLTLLEVHGYSGRIIDLRAHPELLHLKTGLTALSDGRLLAVESLSGLTELRDYAIVPVPASESYAANAVGINGRVFLARGFPTIEASLRKAGYDVVTLEMSEFQKMDGGVSCLSIRL